MVGLQVRKISRTNPSSLSVMISFNFGFPDWSKYTKYVQGLTALSIVWKKILN